MSYDAIRGSIITYYMENPCLSEEADYGTNEERLVHYTGLVNTMTDQEAETEYNMLRDEGLLEG